MTKWKGFDKNVSATSKTDENLIKSEFSTALFEDRGLQKQRKVWKCFSLMMLRILIQDKGKRKH